MDEQTGKQLAGQLRKPEGEEGIKTGEWMNKGNAQMNMDTIKALNPSPGDAILEIGMGNGFFVSEILGRSENSTYTGCDFSDVMVQQAIKNNEQWVKNKRASFILSDVASLPLENNTFTKVFTVNTVYFWSNPPKVLRELKRVLKPNGLLIIALRPKHQMEKYPFTKYGFNMFSREDITRLLTDNHFKITTITENNEPDFVLNNETIVMENMVVMATPV